MPLEQLIHDTPSSFLFIDFASEIDMETSLTPRQNMYSNVRSRFLTQHVCLYEIQATKLSF